MKSNEQWSSQLCSLAQRLRAQTSHPLTKSWTKISKIRRSPRQEKCESCLPKGKVGIHVFFEPPNVSNLLSHSELQKLVLSKVLLIPIRDKFGCINSSAKIPNKITSCSINKGYVLENTAVWLLLTLSVVSHDKLNQRFEIALYSALFSCIEQN